MKILLVEKNEAICAYVNTGLQENYCNVDVCTESYNGLKLALDNKYDVIVIDALLPYFNGFDLSRRIRQNNIKTPIIMISEINLHQDKVTAFNYGADDFIVKPFNFDKLFKSIKKAYKRNLKNNLFNLKNNICYN